ncbi:GNAT family N-acetyltransferase [Synechococcus sp. CS-1328]|uniref:GNAT family N-acetyltransferase n=1 Tax=Synechococcus sp. CS-1328 TaxID=2847976 RepID=UPI00223A93D4|nr:GNAT family N-acetyltransferase [Synechococcus sp. CS-1328]MCT0226579.1 GNAT family N-acetyltransferase [Synechococcus sp. CS-1328]
MTLIRPLVAEDLNQLIDLYHDAVISQAQGLYSTTQIEAWATNAARGDAVRSALCSGYGLASCAAADPQRIEAFAVLDPIDRLSLLYCRGRSSRQGRATALLLQLEDHARHQGCGQLRTEASQLSRPLLTRLGWSVQEEEVVLFGGATFLRWRMIKPLR